MSELRQQLETEMKVFCCRVPLIHLGGTHFLFLWLITVSSVAAQNEKTLAKACEKARSEKKKLQEELAKSQEELLKLRDKLVETEAELQAAKQE